MGVRIAYILPLILFTGAASAQAAENLACTTTGVTATDQAVIDAAVAAIDARQFSSAAQLPPEVQQKLQSAGEVTLRRAADCASRHHWSEAATVAAAMYSGSLFMLRGLEGGSGLTSAQTTAARAALESLPNATRAHLRVTFDAAEGADHVLPLAGDDAAAFAGIAQAAGVDLADSGQRDLFETWLRVVLQIEGAQVDFAAL